MKRLVTLFAMSVVCASAGAGVLDLLRNAVGRTHATNSHNGVKASARTASDSLPSSPGESSWPHGIPHTLVNLIRAAGPSARDSQLPAGRHSENQAQCPAQGDPRRMLDNAPQ